ncbi:AMP-binding protein [Streptomyces sp. NPDC048281]|uniref:AMP-binding protein n=1 Tax=Streptomyces sp. NPDC048281 TaxID=3154715 RepID=UPI00342A1E87
MFRSEYADVEPVELPIHEAVLGRAAEFGDAPALIDGTTLTYAQLDRFHRRIAAALADAGVRKGDVLALHSPNTVAFPTAFYAATRAGASVTTVHPLATPEEFAKQLTDSAARWIVTVSPLLEAARRAAELAGGRVITRSGEQFAKRGVRRKRGTKVWDCRTATSRQGRAGIPRPRRSAGAGGMAAVTSRSNVREPQPRWVGIPLRGEGGCQIYGLTARVNAPSRRGASAVLPRFDLQTFLAASQNHRITGLYVAPPIALAKHPKVADYDLSSLKYVMSAAAPLDARLAAACSQRLGLPPVAQAYGMTELSPGTHVTPLDALDQAPPGTVGKLIAGTEMRIVSLDDPHKDVITGEPGEILIRGPQVMKGYLGRPDATADMIDTDGWLHTGDVGHVDADGWLFVVDRVKELIKYKGFQVAPAELEALLLTHPGIADAAVVGAYNEDGNEIPHAFVVRQPTAGDLTENETMLYVAERVAPYKRVRKVTFIAGVPRAASGKILRRELRALAKTAEPEERP